MFKPTYILSGALLTVALLTGQIARADDATPVHLIIKPVVGRVIRVNNDIKITLMGMEVELQSVEKSTVTAVQANGDVVMEIVDEGGKMMQGGQEQAMPGSPAYSLTRDKFGKTKQNGKKEDSDGFIKPEISKLMDTIADIVLTDKALKPNDTWQYEVENPIIKEKKVLVKDTYLGADKIDGTSYWKVKQTAEAIVDANGGKVSYEVTEWIDTKTGETVQLDGTVHDVPTTSGLMTMHVIAKSIKAADKGK